MAQQSEIVSEIVDIDFDVGDYARSITNLRNQLATDDFVFDRDHPVLATQNAKQPATWLRMKLLVPDHPLLVAIRGDNVYLKGFQNKNGEWYELFDRECRNPDIGRALPKNWRAKPLLCGISHRNILGVTGKRIFSEMGGMELGQASFIRAAQRLWTHGDGTDLDPGFRRALSGLVVMICECARMTPHYETVSGGWVDGTGRVSSDQYVKYIWNWMPMSHMLLLWKSDHYGAWPQTCRIAGTPDAALGVVKLVGNWKGGRDEESASTGKPGPDPFPHRPCVEILGVSAKFSVSGTTITVFNGKRHHTIYMYDEDEGGAGSSSGMVDLVLTGPYRTISVYGCFVIQVDIPADSIAGGEEGESSGGDRRRRTISWDWEWDGYDKDVYREEVQDPPVLVPDRFIRSSSQEYPDCDIRVTYAVIPFAVEAHLRVSWLHLRGGATPVVYGTISARAECFDRGSILFSRDERRPVHLTPSFLLPLARSFVAVPFGSPLHVEMDLTILDDDNGSRRKIQGNVEFREGRAKGILEQQAGSVQVDITWYPEFTTDTDDTPTIQQSPPLGFVKEAE